MTAITYGANASAAASESKTDSLFKRFVNAVYESRIRAAQREINRHLHLVPRDILEQAGYAPSAGGTKLPLA
jgi:hypothetical protein